MSTEEQQIRIQEDPKVVDRYNVLVELGQVVFGQSETLKQGKVTGDDVELAYNFLREAAQAIVPPVRATWWEHTFLAAKAGRMCVEALLEKDSTLASEVNPFEMEFFMLMHDIGRLVTPGDYHRNDRIAGGLFNKIGIGREITKKGFSLTGLMKASIASENKDDFYRSLSLSQRIGFMVDNLAKRTDSGELFTLEAYSDYLDTEEERYGKEAVEQKHRDKERHPWSSLDLGQKGRKTERETKIGPHIVKQTYEWLREKGVNIDEIWQELAEYGPKFMVIARHGALDLNIDPPARVYNQDRCMEKDDIVHLSKLGQRQMHDLGQLIRNHQFRVKQVWSSPSVRAEESAQKLGMNSVSIEVIDELDDIYAPGLYKEGYTMADLREFESNPDAQAELAQIAEDHDHESRSQLAVRMREVFDQAASNLSVGETAILVSHGDAIACLARSLLAQEVPLSGGGLKKGIYPEKGNALVAVVDPRGEIFTLYYIQENNPTNLY